MIQITISSGVTRSALDAIEDLLDEVGAQYRVDHVDPGAPAAGGFRVTDPNTSKKAAFDAIPRSGTNRRKALEAVVSSLGAGMTYAEVEEATGINGVWKRLSELKDGGWIVVSGQRRVPKTGSDADVYVATLKALQWAGRV